ncbi:Uncharacterised protein [uncultured Clostridium sp.]|nr:Uncharacterised protein [uncultured Clostridium sp.]
MAIRASAQIDLIDLTDGFTVVLTNENHTFLGTTSAVDGTQTATCQVQVLQGENVVNCEVGDVTCPTGLSIVSDGKTPVPTLTITATSALTKSGSVIIPVKIGEITINKTFSWSIAFRGSNGTSVTIKSTEVTYQVGTSGTTAPTGTWQSSVPTVPQGSFLWTKTVVTYSDGKSTTAYSVAYYPKNGENGTSVTITKNEITYQVGTSGTSAPTGTWSSTMPSVPQGSYLWTRTIVTYSDGNSTTSYSVSRQPKDGTNGVDGKDAITMAITSSNGTIFKNTAIATTLTAHVYKGGVEVTGSALSSLGTIKWYQDGATTSTASGSTLTVQAGDVDSRCNYNVQLEG